MNYLAAELNPGDPQTWSTGLIVLGSILGVFSSILVVVLIIWFITWIKYSWFHTTNSANLSGGQLSQVYLQKYGVNAKRIKFRGTGSGPINNINVESSYFYLRPYTLKENNLTLRIAPWTYHRTSIYSLAMAMQNTWAISSSKSTGFNTFWWDFSRRISLLVVLLPFVFAIIFVLNPDIGWSGFASANSNIFVIILSIVGAVFLIVYSFSQLVFYSKVGKEVAENLKGILLPKEINAIRWIYQIKLVYWIIRTIYEILRFIMQILMLLGKSKK